MGNDISPPLNPEASVLSAYVMCHSKCLVRTRSPDFGSVQDEIEKPICIREGAVELLAARGTQEGACSCYDNSRHLTCNGAPGCLQWIVRKICGPHRSPPISEIPFSRYLSVFCSEMLRSSCTLGHRRQLSGTLAFVTPKT